MMVVASSVRYGDADANDLAIVEPIGYASPKWRKVLSLEAQRKKLARPLISLVGGRSNYVMGYTEKNMWFSWSMGL